MKRRLFIPILVSFLLFNLFVPQSSAEELMVNPGVFYTVDNGNYSVSVPMVFSQINSMPGPGSHWITFNNSGFNLTSASVINVSLAYLDADVVSVPVGTTVLRFYANSSVSVDVRFFNISGFRSSWTYSLFKDGVFDANIVSSVAGELNFSHVFGAGTHVFELVDQTIVIPPAGGGGSGAGSGVYFVTVRVQDDESAAPIAGATVTLEGVSIKTTDGLGEAVFYFLLGTQYPYVLHVSAPGYVDVNLPVRFNASQTLTVNMSSLSGDQDTGVPGFEFMYVVAGAAICMMIFGKKLMVVKKR